jgi:hypothetical protein
MGVCVSVHAGKSLSVYLYSFVCPAGCVSAQALPRDGAAASNSHTRLTFSTRDTRHACHVCVGGAGSYEHTLLAMGRLMFNVDAQPRPVFPMWYNIILFVPSKNPHMAFRALSPSTQFHLICTLDPLVSHIQGAHTHTN